MKAPGRLFRIESQHFVAAVIVGRGNLVTQAAPIVRYFKGSSLGYVRKICAKRGWTLSEIADGSPSGPPLDAS